MSHKINHILEHLLEDNDFKCVRCQLVLRIRKILTSWIRIRKKYADPRGKISTENWKNMLLFKPKSELLKKERLIS